MMGHFYCGKCATTLPHQLVWMGVVGVVKSLQTHFHTTTPLGVWGVVWCDLDASVCGKLGVEI